MRSRRSERRSRYLIDTSALYPMLLKGTVVDPTRFVVSRLTEFEIGNVIWKEHQKGNITNPERVAELFYDAIGELRRLDIDLMPRVLLLAVDRKLTFYDASYAYLAEREHLVLVTQDEDLRRKTKNAIGVGELE
ncbi:MAG: type II toxin-antitoxin system VapC family toxin [Candidatus Micrarchaeota archaeon]|nr:type II toxin-antitoxin system VapC family toxin [Candidatus Micrarchaeota archaeon]